MRNLKRAVSLALASIMLMGTMVIGTSATNFSDADSIVNTDAVTVLSALDVMRGRDTGDFDPTAVVTRAEMAAILCRVTYGADVNTSNSVGVANFTDTVGHWAEGYVGMAASEGWVVGNGDGTFSPDATVTTAQAAIMMQRALGYYSSKDTTVDPANYVLDAIRLGNKIDLFDGISVASNQGLSRDDVAAMTYNMMFNAMRVGYSVFTELYYAIDVDSPSVTNPDVSVEDDKTIAALVFDVTIEGDVDLMGRPVKNVIVDKETLASTAVDYTAIFVDSSEADDVNKKMSKDMADNDNLVLNGEITTLDKVFDGDDESFVGVVIEVYDDYAVDGESDKNETVYVAYTYSYGEVKKVEYDEDDDVTTIRIDSKNYTIDGETSFEKEDMVMFTAAGDELDTLTAALTVEGEVTSVATSYARVDGDRYDFITDGLLTASELGDTYALYLTPYGYVMGVEEVENNGDVDANYLYVSAAAEILGAVSAKVVFADGSEQVIEVSEIYEGDDYVDCTSVNTGSSGQLVFDKNTPADSVFSYEISNDKYKLTAETGVEAAGGAFITNSHNSSVDTNGNLVAGFLIFDDETIFVDVENGTNYVGFENVPSYGAFTSGDLFYVDNVVFMLNGELDDSEAGTYVYLEETDMYTTKINGDTYYVYTEAYINGELVKAGLISEKNNLTKGVIYEVELDSNGYVTDVVDTIALATAADTGLEVRTAGSSTIYTVAGNRYTYDSDSVFVLIDLIDETISAGSAKDLLEQNADEDEMTQLMVLSDDDGYIEVAYIILSEK